MQNRVHSEILRLARQAGVKANAARIDPAPRHTEIASQVSTYREQVTRELSQFIERGALTQLLVREALVDGLPLTQHWLIPEDRRPRLYTEHPTMALEEIRLGTQRAWDRFYSWRYVWARSRVVESMRARIAFVLISKLYRQMYAGTGIATDSARVQRSARWARWARWLGGGKCDAGCGAVAPGYW